MLEVVGRFGLCDTPNPGGSIDHRQSAKNLYVSYHETHT